MSSRDIKRHPSRVIEYYLFISFDIFQMSSYIYLFFKDIKYVFLDFYIHLNLKIQMNKLSILVIIII